MSGRDNGGAEVAPDSPTRSLRDHPPHEGEGRPHLVQLRAIEKWNGVLPTYTGGQGAMPFIGIGK